MPCKDCEDRCVGCHGKCEKYISWQEEWREIQSKKKAYLNRTDYREGIEVYKSKMRIQQYGDKEMKHKYGVYQKKLYK